MFYTTSYNRFGAKYTKESVTRPDLLNIYNLKPYNINLMSIPEIPQDKISYTQFRIPKASGGFRTITAPSEELKQRQRIIIQQLQDSCKIKESNWAYAYVRNTSALDALQKHQANNSNWFLKLDIKDFFPSCTKEVVINSLDKIYPICSWDTDTREKFYNIIDKYCFFNNALPQGAVSSPLLSNLTMTPYDFRIQKMLREAHNFSKQKYIYTRYADDILISAKQPFDWNTIQANIQNIFDNNFNLNTRKTRYGSKAGRNWNLGCMLNKDNDITIGFRQKEDWKHTMMDIIIRHHNNEPISSGEKARLTGKLSYYKSIEPGYFNYLNQHYLEKYNANFEEIIKTY